VDEDMEDAEGEEDHVHEQPCMSRCCMTCLLIREPMGIFAIANGDVGVADVRAAARERSLIKSSVFVKNIAREMARLRRANARLQQANYEKDNALQYYKVTAELTLVHIYETLFCFVLLICIHSSLCIT
jgi:hypothetical protein